MRSPVPRLALQWIAGGAGTGLAVGALEFARGRDASSSTVTGLAVSVIATSLTLVITFVGQAVRTRRGRRPTRDLD